MKAIVFRPVGIAMLPWASTEFVAAGRAFTLEVAWEARTSVVSAMVADVFVGMLAA